MKKINKKKLTMTIVCIIIFIVIILIAVRIPIIKQIINLVFISFIVAYILKPLYMLLIKKGVNKKAASALIIVGLAGLIALTLIVVIPSLFRESLYINKAINELQNYLINANMKDKGIKH